jgi:glycerophosphoryl diester phosphodiesterase
MTSWWRRTAVGLRIGGHRGAASVAPENTLAGVYRAIELGVDYVELDVHLARDGELVVIHDEDLGRTTDGTGRVGDRTADELRALDAGRWFGPDFAGEPVPRLADVLDALAATSAGERPVGAVLEAKGRATGGPLARALARAPLHDRLAICSFDAEELRAARAAETTIPTMLIVDRDRPDDDPVALARACGASLVNVPAAWLGAWDVERLHAAGLGVAGGTGDDEATIRHAIAVGLDAIDSNEPGRALGWRAAAAGVA